MLNDYEYDYGYDYGYGYDGLSKRANELSIAGGYLPWQASSEAGRGTEHTTGANEEGLRISCRERGRTSRVIDRQAYT